MICLNQYHEGESHQCIRNIPWWDEAIQENYQYQHITPNNIVHDKEQEEPQQGFWYNGEVIKNPWQQLDKPEITKEPKWEDYAQGEWLEEEVSDQELLKESRWEETHFIYRGRDIIPCQTKKQNSSKERREETHLCNNSDHHSHWYCKECNFCHNPVLYKDDPTEDSYCYCKEPSYVLNVLCRDGKVWLSKRKQKPMKGLLQVVTGKVEKKESSLDAVLRETEEETGLQIEEDRPQFLLNDPAYNTDIYITKLKRTEEPQLTEPTKMDKWKTYTVSEYTNKKNLEEVTPSLITYHQQICEQILQNAEHLELIYQRFRKEHGNILLVKN